MISEIAILLDSCFLSGFDVVKLFQSAANTLTDTRAAFDISHRQVLSISTLSQSFFAISKQNAPL